MSVDPVKDVLCYSCVGDGVDSDGKKCRRCNGTGIDPG